MWLPEVLFCYCYLFAGWPSIYVGISSGQSRGGVILSIIAILLCAFCSSFSGNVCSTRTTARAVPSALSATEVLREGPFPDGISPAEGPLKDPADGTRKHRGGASPPPDFSAAWAVARIACYAVLGTPTREGTAGESLERTVAIAR